MPIPNAKTPVAGAMEGGLAVGQRLRSACNECHASKVKCSGERAGCQRCISSGYECQFEVSMVGRCSKGRQRRHKRSRTEAGDGGIMCGADISAMAGEGTSQTRTSIDGEKNGTPRHLSASISASGSGSADAAGVEHFPFDLTSTQLLHWDSIVGFDCAGLLSADSEFDTSTLDETFGNTLNRLDTNLNGNIIGSQLTFATSHQPTPYTSAPNPPNPEISTQPDTKAFNKTTGNRILFNVLLNLEAQISASESSIDRTMHTVQTSTKEVQDIIQSGHWQEAIIGPILAFAAIEVSLILIEGIVSRWNGNKNTSDILPICEQQSSHALLLGQYKAETEEAANIWRRIIMAELRRLRKLIEMLKSYLDDSSRCWEGRSVERLKNSCVYQDQKVGSLITTLQRHDEEGTCGSSF